MSSFEFLTLIVSCIAVLLSLYTLSEQRKMQREANDLQKATDQLAKHQIEQIAKDEAARQTTTLEVELRPENRGYLLCISNAGFGEAFDVDITFNVAEGVTNPISPRERERLQLPLKILRPAAWALMQFTFYMDGPASFEGVITWRNQDGSRASEPFKVVL